jgi:hypothetical protein
LRALGSPGGELNELEYENLYWLKRLDKIKPLRHTATTMRTDTLSRTLEPRTISSGSIVLVLSILPL